MRTAPMVLAVSLVVACGRDDKPMPPLPHVYDDAGRLLADASPPELPKLELGVPALGDFAWRKRAGQAAFRVARKAEDREDWIHVVQACHEVLATDPSHLEAAWLLAIALAKIQEPAGEILEPLTVAVSGDFGKWGKPSLEQPALQTFLASELGREWKQRVELDRPRYAEALARALIVKSAGELYAFDPDRPRWYRLTRTYGAVVGALAVPDTRLVYYVTSRAQKLQVGVVDLATGHSSRPQELGTSGPIAIAHDAKGAWISAGAVLRQLDDEGFLHPLPAHTPRPVGAWLEVSGRSARAHYLPIQGITADWDDRGLASAIRLASSGRVVSIPAGQIDGDTVTWSPDRAHVAFVAVLDENCKPGAPVAAAYVVDADTGTLHEIARATSGLAIAWLGDHRVALAGTHGIDFVDPLAPGGGAGAGSGSDALPALTGPIDLLARKSRARCTPPDAPADEADPDEADTDAPADAAVSSPDAR